MQTAGLTGSRLSSQQARLWSIRTEESDAVTLCALLIEGELDRDILCKMLQRMVDQHEILRTTFYPLPGMNEPVQVVSVPEHWSFSVLNLENIPKNSQYAHLDMLLSLLQKETGDLEHGPALKVWLLHLSADSHILLISLPTLCADASTLKIFINELQSLYTYYLQGLDADLEEPLQYADVAAWQQELVQEEGEEQREYWLRRDLTALATSRLPFEPEDGDSALPASSVSGPGPCSLAVPLEGELLLRVREYARQQDVSLEVLLLAVWLILLQRFCNDVPLLGVACDGRFYEELEQVLGLYTRLVPFSVLIERDRSFAQVLARVKHELAEAVKRQVYFTWEATSMSFPM